jgi:hypothetical protein
MQKAMLLIFSAFFTSLSVIGCGNKAEDQAESSLVSYPQRIDPDCRTGSARLYDECSSQVRLFEAALTRANAAEKHFWSHLELSGAFGVTFLKNISRDSMENLNIHTPHQTSLIKNIPILFVRK